MILKMRVWCESLIIAVIITLIIELILPEGNNKKYIKVVIGLYLMFMVFDPFLKIVLNNDFYTSKIFEFKQSNVISVASEDKLIEDIYIDGLKRNIQKELTIINYGLILNSILFDEGYENITYLEIIKPIEFVDDEKVIKLIEEKFLVDRSNVYIGVKR